MKVYIKNIHTCTKQDPLYLAEIKRERQGLEPVTTYSDQKILELVVVVLIKNGQPVFIPNSNVKTIHFNVIYFNYSKIRRLDLNWLTVCVCHKLQLWALCNLILLSDFIFCWIKGPFVFEHTSFSLWFITISFISSDLQLHIFDDIFR